MADPVIDDVSRGRLTFNAEGNNTRGSRFYSRVIHHPDAAISGVTIGRGYDMGSRSQSEIYSDLVRAGVDVTKAQAISQASRLRGAQAAEFVRRNRDVIGEISEQQQINLFNQHYPSYEQRAQSNYERRTAYIPGRPGWSELHPAIRDVLVDLSYQGIEGETSVPVAAQNNIDCLINHIRNTAALSRYEGNRNRAGYLDANR